jgi:hypothetical protein
MAPEQFQGRALPASDVYAIGATALSMLTGRQPEDLPHRGLGIDVRVALGDRASPRLAEALGGMLDPDPDRRSARIAPVLAQLERGDRSVRRTSPGAERRARWTSLRTRRRSRWLASRASRTRYRSVASRSFLSPSCQPSAPCRQPLAPAPPATARASYSRARASYSSACCARRSAITLPIGLSARRGSNAYAALYNW